jgi:hypothetical protein
MYFFGKYRVAASGVSYMWVSQSNAPPVLVVIVLSFE